MNLPDPIRTTPLTPSAVLPGAIVDQTAALPEVPPGAEVRIVGYRPHGGALLPIYEAQQPTPRTAPRDLSPQPILDPLAQRIAAGGVLAAGIGFGGWLLFTPAAAVCLAALALLVVALRFPTGRRGSTTIHVHQRAGLFGRNHNTN